MLNELDWWVESQWADNPVAVARGRNRQLGGNTVFDKSHGYRAMRTTRLKEMHIVRYADDFRIFCQNNRAERETHMEMLSLRQSEMIEKIFDTYHADYFSVMGYEIGIIDGDLAQALRELSDKKIQIVLLYYFVGLSDREIGEIYGTGRSTICDQRNNAIKKLRLLMEEMYHGK